MGIESSLFQRWRSMKIGLRILLGYFVIVALAAWMLGQVFIERVKPGVRQAMEDTLVDTSSVLAELAKEELLAGTINGGHFARSVRQIANRDIGAEIWGFSKREVSTRVYVTDAKGIVVFDSAGFDIGKDYSQWNDVYLTLRGRYGARSTRTNPDDDSSSVMHVAAPIYAGDSGGRKIIGVLTVAKPNSSIEPFILHNERIVRRSGLILLGTALLIGLGMAWWLSRQLASLRRYADAVAAGERVAPPDAAGEFGDLGRALATMRDKLEGKQYVEQYVHALTHELKSPLAAIRGSAELLESPGDETPMAVVDRARFVTTIRAQSDRMAEMIDKLLALAAVEHRQRIEQPQRIELPATFAEVGERIKPKFESRSLRLKSEVESVAVMGDEFLIRQSILNLLENAADFAPNGSEIELQLHRDKTNAIIEVRDRGPGVPDYALDRAFERFYSLARPDGGSRSSGLGLCFVAEVMELHGGSVTLVNREAGGAVASLILPLASPA